LLGSSILSPSSHPDIVCSMALCDSLEWKSRSQVEWLIAMHIEALHESFILNLGSVFFIYNLPSLVSTIVSVPDNDFSSFFILTSVNIKAFVGLLNVTEVFSTIDKDLPPSRVGTPDLHVVGLSRVLDIP
jgi:hypothetical protein